MAESLTGGLVTAELTATPGSSAVVCGGVVAYATEAKRDVLGISSEILAHHGAVSAATVEAMAVGVRGTFGADIGIATTGVAGPDTQEGHAVGTVFIGASWDANSIVRELALTGDRAEIRARTVESALQLLLDIVTAGLSHDPGITPA